MATASAPYDFDAFLTSMAPLDYIEILRRADAECARAERGSSGRGGLRDRKLVDVTYARRVGNFYFSCDIAFVPRASAITTSRAIGPSLKLSWRKVN